MKMHFLNFIFIVIVKTYQLFISPLLGANCRFYPTCSAYAIEAFRKKPFITALGMTISRIVRCNPWGGKGFDPIFKDEGKIDGK